jgi:hypothetical protein
MLIVVVVAALTVCPPVNVPLLPLKLLLLLVYSAVMLCAAPVTVSFVVLKIQTPPPLAVPVPRRLLLSLKMTVPVGVPEY